MYVIESLQGYWNVLNGWVENFSQASVYNSKAGLLPNGEEVMWIEL